MKQAGVLLLALCSLSTAQARPAEYSENQSSEDRIALGFPVPEPVASSTPLAGFRRYDSLIGALSLKALQRDDFERREIGRSQKDRPIYAFRFGLSERAVMLQVGGLHAREWASPEAVAGIAEALLSAADDGGAPPYGSMRAVMISRKDVVPWRLR